jgi:hypothetical protein
MTIVQLTTIHPNPGVKWEDVQKRIKKACDLARKHGAENVTVLVTMIGGQATNTIGVLSSTEDRARYGKVQRALLNHLGVVRQPDDPGYVTGLQTLPECPLSREA